MLIYNVNLSMGVYFLVSLVLGGFGTPKHSGK